jgi:hypothetical protein
MGGWRKLHNEEHHNLYSSPSSIGDLIGNLIKLMKESRGPPLWFNGESSWVQIHRSGFDSRRYQIFWEGVGLERGPLSIESTIVELLGRKSSGSGLEAREYGRRDPSRWPRGTIYPQTFALISPTSGGRLVGIVRSRTQATEFSKKLPKITVHILQAIPSKYSKRRICFGRDRDAKKKLHFWLRD